MMDARGPTQAEWLVLAYLAGDNDLEGALLDDLGEMERVGSRPGAVEILAQVDRAAGFDASGGDWQTTRRYYVTRSAETRSAHGQGADARGAGRRRIASRLLADLGETNTGDPRVLEDFIAFGARQFPARACAVILLNHGSGFYVPPEMLSKTRLSPTRRGGFFHTTRRRLAALHPERRGIAYDDASADCLDNRELKAVLRHAHRVLGHRVDLVGMDACLMTMLEVAYQLRDHARILVGSEELEPGAGWPHDRILADLTARPAMA
ncbi:MAG: hypothetical protein HY727_05025, partial [Candidatus Rokubacteria bacterium]|nr:hypothetical protein [Candidatus Rokubacteria bacterium]